MEALTDDRANPAGPQNKGVFHGRNLLINNNLSFRRNPSSRKGSPREKGRRKKEFWQGEVPRSRDALSRGFGILDV
jgi:hypothetical protein